MQAETIATVKVKATKPTEAPANKTLWAIHHWVGLYAGVIIVVLCFTGAVAVFIPEIDALLYQRLAKVEPKASSLSFQKSLNITRQQLSDFDSYFVELPETPDEAVKLRFFKEGKTKRETEQVDVFVDPYRDQVLGRRDYLNSFTNYLRQMHVRLYESNWGRQLVGLGGIAFLISTVTGLLIYGRFMKRQLFGTIRHGRGLRIVTADWHKLIGISALLFNLIIALTGAWLGLQPKIMKWLSMKTPNTYRAEIRIEKAADTALNWQVNNVLAQTKFVFPDLLPKRIEPSTDGSRTVEVYGDITGQVYEPAISKVVLDKQTYELIYKYDIREQSFGDRLYFVQEALHFGHYGGLAVKFIYFILGMATAFLAISGFVVYLYRTQKKAKRQISEKKLVFTWCLGSLLFLGAVAFISVQAGYTFATEIVAVIINASLGGLLVYGLIRAFVKKKTRVPAV